MKLSDIKAKFKDQWVLAKVTKEDKDGQALEVEPIAQAPTKKDLEAKLESCRERHITVVYTGKPKARL